MNKFHSEIKLHFRDGSLWMVDLTVEIKLHFRDGLLWKVDLTVEIKLCLQISPAWCGRDLTTISNQCNQTFCVCIKTRIRGKPFMWQCVPLDVHFHVNQTHFHIKGLG